MTLEQIGKAGVPLSQRLKRIQRRPGPGAEIRAPEEAYPLGVDLRDPGAKVNELRRSENPAISFGAEMVPCDLEDLLTEIALGAAMGPFGKLAKPVTGGKIATKVIDKTKEFAKPAQDDIRYLLSQLADKVASAGAGPAFQTPDILKTALRQVDQLGFDSIGEALGAILKHPDWMDRWDVADLDPGILKIIKDWRRKEIVSNPEVGDAVRKYAKKFDLGPDPDLPNLQVDEIIKAAKDEKRQEIIWDRIDGLMSQGLSEEEAIRQLKSQGLIR